MLGARGLLTVGVLAALLSACEGVPRNPAAERAGREAQTLLVLPLNVVMTLPASLEESSDPVWNELRAYLEAHGKRVETIPLRDARRAWRESIAVVRKREKVSGSRFDAAASVLALKLHQQHAFDALIVPSLFVQTAEMSARSASWDGVRRHVDIDREVYHVGSIATIISMSGGIPAISLLVVVLDAGGHKLLQGQGGLELLVRIGVKGEEGAPVRERRWRFEPRRNPFPDPAHVREGITRALLPFLSPLTADAQ